MNRLFILLLVLGVSFVPVFGQEAAPTPQPTAEEIEKEKAEREKNAYRLLDQVIDEAQSLRLPENRVRVQTTAADLLWDGNPGRARSLFSMAAETIAEMGRQEPNETTRRGGPQNAERRAFQLRQELVLTAARHDAQLAYQLLAITKPATLPENADARRQRPQFSSEDNLEQALLARIAALDPRLAAQNAEQMMEKGQFPRTLPEVLNHLFGEDYDAAAKLADKTARKLQTTNLLTNSEAAVLAQALLARGPRGPEKPRVIKVTGNAMLPLLDQSVYADLLGSVVDLALKAVPRTPQTNQRGPAQRGRPAVVMAPGRNLNSSGISDAQMEQNGALRLLGSLQAFLPLIDQYAPSKAAGVRQKLSEAGMSNNSALNFGQAMNALRGNPSADALVQAAAVAPPQMQSRLYQQAAFKAVEEGNLDQARQIATNHLESRARDSVIQRIDFRELAQKADSTRLEEIRQTVARLQTDNEKLNLLLQLARATQATNPKLAAQVLEDAQQLTNRRAANYEQLSQQLMVAHAFATVDPARSFDILDPGISQLNELLAAAMVLNGFELNFLRDGEISFQANSGLTSMIQRFGRELGVLADKDPERAETLSGRFQSPEARIMARLAIVQGLLGKTTPNTANFVNVFRN